MVRVALAQGCYFLITGIWPLLHIKSFQMVTERKTDLWLVKTVRVLVLVIGAGLVVAGITQPFARGLILIAMASTVSLMGVDLVHAFKRVISLVYVLDALLEAGFPGVVGGASDCHLTSPRRQFRMLWGGITVRPQYPPNPCPLKTRDATLPKCGLPWPAFAFPLRALQCQGGETETSHTPQGCARLGY